MLCVAIHWVLSGAKWRRIRQLRCCVLPAKLMKRRDVYLKLTRHNGRAGAHGTTTPKHNDQVSTSPMAGTSTRNEPRAASAGLLPRFPFGSTHKTGRFIDLLQMWNVQFYETHYTAFIESQNRRNARSAHGAQPLHSDLLSSRKTCGEESIYQLGTLDEHASARGLAERRHRVHRVSGLNSATMFMCWTGRYI